MEGYNSGRDAWCVAHLCAAFTFTMQGIHCILLGKVIYLRLDGDGSRNLVSIHFKSSFVAFPHRLALDHLDIQIVLEYIVIPNKHRLIGVAAESKYPSKALLSASIFKVQHTFL